MKQLITGNSIHTVSELMFVFPLLVCLVHHHEHAGKIWNIKKQQIECYQITSRGCLRSLNR